MKPLLLVRIHARPMAANKKVMPAVRLFLMGFLVEYDGEDLICWLITQQTSNLLATLSSAATAPWE